MAAGVTRRLAHSIPSWPLQQLTVRRLDGHQLQLISFVENTTLSLRGIFITDLAYTPAQGLQPASDKLRCETSWGELVYAGLTSRGGEARAKSAPTATVCASSNCHWRRVSSGPKASGGATIWGCIN